MLKNEPETGSVDYYSAFAVNGNGGGPASGTPALLELRAPPKGGGEPLAGEAVLWQVPVASYKASPLEGITLAAS